ncbi:MAG: glycosyltransferase family 4 protein [Ignavibacteriaceae bacterium]|nr:glycosyltransferase family 4 protein [Ignavibacteriaceae bacterium]
MTKNLKQIKILYLVKTMAIGGAERFTLNLSRYFKDKTYSITVASSGGLFVGQLESSGIKHIILKTPPELNNIISLYKELLSIIKENDYTIIHCQHRIFTFLLQFVLNRKFILLYTSHNLFNDLFQRFIFPDYAAAVSESIYNNLLSTSFLNKNKITRINLGVLVPENYPAPRGIITFGFFGRLIKEKGIFDLLESVKILASENIRFRLIIRGKGELNKITEFIEINNLSEIISIMPPAYDENEIYKDVHVLVLPTQLNEGLPISILEAAARRVLIVSSDAGGVKDFLKDQNTGVMLSKLDPVTIAGTLKEIILNYGKYLSTLDNALNLVRDGFSLETANKKYEKLYNRILETTDP